MLEIGIIIAVLIGLGQVAKNLGMPEKYIPLMNLVLGVIAGLFGGVPGAVFERIVYGAIVGLSASGLYDQKKIADKK